VCNSNKAKRALDSPEKLDFVEGRTGDEQALESLKKDPKKLESKLKAIQTSMDKREKVTASRTRKESFPC
jgi:hypothetical protein